MSLIISLSGASYWLSVGRFNFMLMYDPCEHFRAHYHDFAIPSLELQRLIGSWYVRTRKANTLATVGDRIGDRNGKLQPRSPSSHMSALNAS